MGNLLILIGILISIYSVIARLTIGRIVDLSIVKIQTLSVLVSANTIILIGIAVKLWGM